VPVRWCEPEFRIDFGGAELEGLSEPGEGIGVDAAVQRYLAPP
jgi:hypothetical protein